MATKKLKTTKKQTVEAIDKDAEKFYNDLPRHPGHPKLAAVTASALALGVTIPPEILAVIVTAATAAGVPAWLISALTPLIQYLLKSWEPGQIIDWLKKRFGQ